jgi:uncharacterized protein YunC (DUF1805 family)
MPTENTIIDGKQIEINVIPLKGVNIVLAKTQKGMIGCGVFDVMALDKWEYPAAKMKGRNGPIVTGQDLLAASVAAANESAKKLGIKEGMSGTEALAKL